MPTPPMHFLPPHEWLDWLGEQSLPASVLPHLIACAAPDGKQVWREDERHPRQAHIVGAALEARKHAAWRSATRTHPSLAALEPAFGRVLAASLLEMPEARLQPSDWIAGALADELGRAIPGRAILHGDAQAIADMLAWLHAGHPSPDTHPSEPQPASHPGSDPRPPSERAGP